jgi:hypothetical protein
MRKTALILVACLVSGLLAVTAQPSGAALPEQDTPPGQITVLSVNGRQAVVLGVKRFKRLYELTKAVRNRPRAFNGGFNGAVNAPDVIIVQEFSQSNFDIFRHVLRQRFSHRYTTAGATNVAAKILFNPTTVEMTGTEKVWTDPCTGGDGSIRHYQSVRLRQLSTGAPFVVAGIHLQPKYDEPERCREENVAEMRRQLEVEALPVFVGGDFNQRARELPRECDPEETSAALPWYSLMTAPTDGGRVYSDAVKDWHLQRGQSLADEWTFERENTAVLCDGSQGLRRGRIDYLFSAGAIVAEAHADHPGWAGLAPGESDPTNFRYSDHRFLWGRFVISGPPQMAPPTVAQAKGGEIDLSWEAVPGATGYVLYRSLEGRDYDVLANIEASETTTYADSATQDGTTYRYSIVAIGVDGGHGQESAPATIAADAVGPRVVAVQPSRDKKNVDIRKTITVWVDEPIDPASVGVGSVRLYRNGYRVQAVTRQTSSKVVTLDPNLPLRYDEGYTVVVGGLTDALGNQGPRYSWKFSTEQRR